MQQAQHKPLLAVLPQDALTPFGPEEKDNGRPFLRLPHPRHNQPSLYLPYKPKPTEGDGPEPSGALTHRIDGLLEVHKLEPEAKRSWFMEQTVVSDGSLMMMTPIDPLFLVIPLVVSLLTSRSKSTRPENGSNALDTTFDTVLQSEKDEKATRTDRFLPLDDLIIEASRMEVYKLEEPFTAPQNGKSGDTADAIDREAFMQRQDEEWVGNEDVIRLCQLQSVRNRLIDICETRSFANSSTCGAEPTTINQDTFYRASPRLILGLLRSKVDKLAHASTLSSFPSLIRQILRSGIDEDIMNAFQAVLDGAAEDADKLQREKNVVMERQRQVADQARIKVACEIIGQYLSANVYQCLVRSYDFSLLEEHLETQAAVAFASSHTVSGKTNGPASTEPAAKPGVKRKGSGQGSRGVESLKKVNTSKMPKLTSFFTKKPKE